MCLGGRCPEAARDEDQSMIHGIHGETEFFERYHSKNRLGALLAEHDDRRLRPRAQSDGDPRHWVADLAAISQDERPFLLGHDAESFQYIARDPAVRRTGIDERFDRLKPPASSVADLDGDSDVTHS